VNLLSPPRLTKCATSGLAFTSLEALAGALYGSAHLPTGSSASKCPHRVTQTQALPSVGKASQRKATKSLAT
jgi:hypothetical protein